MDGAPLVSGRQTARRPIQHVDLVVNFGGPRRRPDAPSGKKSDRATHAENRLTLANVREMIAVDPRAGIRHEAMASP
jgi:hypothetical protein